jgi:hypothetical protein
MVSSFQLTRSTRLGLAHQESTERTGRQHSVSFVFLVCKDSVLQPLFTEAAAITHDVIDGMQQLDVLLGLTLNFNLIELTAGIL